jgi:hypothetical protein
MASDPMRVLLHRLARPPHPFLFRSLWTTCSLKYSIEIRSVDEHEREVRPQRGSQGPRDEPL